MSFAKSKTKRFNEAMSCAPPPGRYNPKLRDKTAGTARIDTGGDRFKTEKEKTPGPGAFNLSSMSMNSSVMSVFKTPTKQPLPLSKGRSSRKQLGSGDQMPTDLKLSMESLISQHEIDRVVQECRQQVELVSNELGEKYNVALKRQQELESALCRAEENLSSSSECITSLRMYRDSLSKQVEDLQQALNAYEYDKFSDDVRIRSLKGEVFAATDQVMQEQQQLFEAQSDVASLTEKCETLEETNTVLNENIRALSDKYQVLEHNLAIVENEANQKEDRLMRDMRGLKRSLCENTEERETLKKGNRDMIAMVQQIQEEKEGLTAHVDRLIVEKKETAKQLEELVQTQTEVQQDLDSHKKKLEEQVNVVSELESAKSALQREVEELREELEQAMDDNESTDREMKAKLEEYGKRMQELEQTTENADKLVADLTEQKGCLEVEVADLKGALSEMKGERESIEKKLAEHIAAHVEQISTLQASQAELENKASELEEVRNYLQGELQQLGAELEASQQEQLRTARELAKTQDEYETKLSSSEEAKLEHVETLERIETELSELNTQLTAAREEKRSVEVELETAVLEYREKLVSLEAENSAHGDKLAQSGSKHRELEEHVEALKEKIAQKQEKIDSLLEMNEKMSLKLSEQASTARQLTEVKENQQRLKEEHEHLVDELRVRLTMAEDEATAADERCIEVEGELNQQLSAKEEEFKKAKAEFSKRIVQTQTKLATLDSDFIKYRNESEHQLQEAEELFQQVRGELEGQIAHLEEQLQEQTSNTDEINALVHDSQRWQKLYEELQAKVEPFMDQLDAFAIERDQLLSVNKDAQSEVDKLGKEYAKLLGHQNQKQKIKHVLKLKEENNTLKTEIHKLRESEMKLKRQLQRMEEKMASLNGGKRFDPSKAFKHFKENAVPTSPLREGNRKH